MASTTDQQAWTIKRLLEWTTEFFQSKELESPRLCAEILLAEALQCQRIELYTRFDEIPQEGNLSVYRDWVKRHAKNEPVAYLVGHKEFYSLKFEVNSNVLIPRPETEHLVLEAIEAAKLLDKPTINIIDVGTGSGCVAITLATQIGNSSIVATDISAAAVEVAAQNARRHQAESKIQFIVTDLLQSVPEDFVPDIIVSNPPYVSRNETDAMDESVKKYEPEIALYAGDEGTELIVRLTEMAADRLVEGGSLIFETSPTIFDRCLEIVAAEHRFADTKTVKDLAGHRRIIRTTKRG